VGLSTGRAMLVALPLSVPTKGAGNLPRWRLHQTADHHEQHGLPQVLGAPQSTRSNAFTVSMMATAAAAAHAAARRSRMSRLLPWQRQRFAVRGIAATATASASVDLELKVEADHEAKPRGPRVRFAPSPTGVLHVGGARTALFNWLFAKSQGGEMVLRIEDTDAARSTTESEEAILEGLKWCGLTWDQGPDVGGPHGPYRQSERLKAGIYQKALDKLMAEGHAYRCFLTAQELDAMRADAERNEQAFVIDSIWATATEAQVQEMLDQGKPFVYRFRVPYDKEVIVDDLVLGEVIWNSDDLGGDFVIVRGNGNPMYNFGVVVDDADMGISHVLRAQEHLMNTPRQILIYEALGLEAPTFGHMPLILAPDRSKLSKRHGAVSVGEYQKQGYLPSGMINYLAQLGWNDGTNKEIYNIEELMQSFSMNRMSKVAAIFDKDKFKWVNGNHIRLMNDEEAESLIGGELVRQGVLREASGNFVRDAAVLLRDRISTLSEAAEELKTMLAYPLEDLFNSEDGQKHKEDAGVAETAKCIVEAQARGELDEVGKDPKALQQVAKTVSEARGGIKKKALMFPLRICLTGRDHGPDMKILFQMMKQIDDNVLCDYVPLSKRVEILKEAFNL